jgi:hypothetical protein
LEWKKTEPNRTESNRFEPVFGSVRFKKLKKKIRFGCLFWFKTGPNRKCSALATASSTASKPPQVRPSSFFFFFFLFFFLAALSPLFCVNSGSELIHSPLFT